MKEISLKNVKKKDWDFILKLRNNQSTRSNFYEQKRIKKSEHYEYLEKQSSNPNFFNFIIMMNQNKVGYVRVLDSDISIMVDLKFSNRGIGTKALQLLEEEMRKSGLKKLVGRVMISNKSSEKIFQKNNYKLKMYWYEKEI